MTAQAIAERDEQTVAIVPSDSAAVLSVIERMATNPQVDIAKLEKLMEMHERIVARNAKASYSSALSAMQAEMPEIEERGQINYAKKETDPKEGPTYALWEDINAAIKPVMSKHGFALSFRTGQTPEGKVTVTGILSHREGHQEETTMVLMHDSSGGKNAVQAIGSSTSYGKRYAASALLNLTTRDSLEKDDDGKASVGTLSNAEGREPYSDMQAEIDACSTLEELEILWKSKPFQIEYQRAPTGWQRSIIERKDDRKRDLMPKITVTVPPNFDGARG